MIELLRDELLDMSSEALSDVLGDCVIVGDMESVGSGLLVTDIDPDHIFDGENVTLGDFESVGDALRSSLGDVLSVPEYSCEGLSRDHVTD